MIGIGITTHNRNDQLLETLAAIEILSPGALIVVVDDGSDKPVERADFRFDESVGIPKAKNKCLELLMDAGVEHLFLFDDDAYPIATDWWQPYVDSPEPHLMFQFLDLTGERKLNDITVLHEDDRHVAYSGARGVMLYFHRSVIERVGGFDPIFGRGMYEHGDLSNRIHNAGLTSWRHADVAGSERLIYSLDQHEAIERSVPVADRREQVRTNARIHNNRRDEGFAGYVEYREQHNVVITTLLTANPDPQRGYVWEADLGLVQEWWESIRGAATLVLADELPTAPGVVGVEPARGNPYFLRWLHLYQHLRDHPEYGWVWATDGTDVEMLHEPWSHMAPGVLYVGSEPSNVLCEWMVKNHPAERLQAFLREYSTYPLLNAGIVGGSREIVMEFAHHMVREHHDLEAARFWGKEPPGAEVGDMATFNSVVYRKFEARFITGPRVHTEFRAFEYNDHSFWRHK